LCPNNIEKKELNDTDTLTDNIYGYSREIAESRREATMKKFIIQSVTLLFIMSAANAFAQNVSTGISVTNGHLNGFYFAIGDYYHVPESRVVYVRHQHHISDEELPVVFFLAARARVDPSVIIDLRMRRRMSWLDITFHYGLTPEIYYVPVTRVGPPYGKAYGYYKKYKKNYKRVVLADDDVINLVNLRFMSEYHGVTPEVIMDRRGRGEKFVGINNDFREARGKDRDSQNNGKKGKNTKDKGKNQGRGNGRG